MPIGNITQDVSTIPAPPHRGVDIQTVFVTKQEDFQDHLQGTTVTELNTLKDQLNTRIGEINSTATTMNGYADTASAEASTATTKAGEASTSASGALTSRNQAETFKNNASASATKASQWADNNYNVEVETGKYSAKHWATVAENFGGDTVKLTGNQTVDGVKTFTSNIVGSITGNSATATNLQTTRTINGVSFDGSSNISVGLNNQSGVFSTSFTLNTTHKNRLLVCENGITITLPTINTIKSGDLFYITNVGLEPLTLALNGNSTNLNTLKVTGGETLVIQSDGGSFYRRISRNSTPIYDFDTNLITPLGYNTVYLADVDLTLVVICTGTFINGAEIVIGTTTSPTRVVSRAGDDINNNTKYATLTTVIPAGLYFKVQGFGGYSFESIEITAYKHK